MRRASWVCAAETGEGCAPSVCDPTSASIFGPSAAISVFGVSAGGGSGVLSSPAMTNHTFGVGFVGGRVRPLSYA